MSATASSRIATSAGPVAQLSKAARIASRPPPDRAAHDDAPVRLEGGDGGAVDGVGRGGVEPGGRVAEADDVQRRRRDRLQPRRRRDPAGEGGGVGEAALDQRPDAHPTSAGLVRGAPKKCAMRRGAPWRMKKVVAMLRLPAGVRG